MKYFLPVKIVWVEVTQDFKFESNPIPLLLCLMVCERHEFAPKCYGVIIRCLAVNVKDLGGIYVPLWIFVGDLGGFCDPGS